MFGLLKLAKTSHAAGCSLYHPKKVGKRFWVCF